jgi:hypothetical protein
MTRNSAALLAFVLSLVPTRALAVPATVAVFEAQVHSAPDLSSPVIHTFPESAQVSVSETATNGFRKVRLPNGKVGYIEERAVALSGKEAPVTPPGPPPGGQPPPPPFAAPPPPPPPPPGPYYVPYRRVIIDPTAYRHLGLYMRLEFGLGYLNSSTTASQTLFNFDRSHGFATDFGFTIGGAVRENFILAGQFWATWAPSPSLTLRGGSLSGGTLSTTLYGFGPSFTWYLMPVNVLFSVTPSVTWINFGDYYYGNYSTDVGFGTRFAVGKEWWVATHWSVGVTGWFVFSINREGGGSNADWQTFAGGIGFSTTLN